MNPEPQTPAEQGPFTLPAAWEEMSATELGEALLLQAVAGGNYVTSFLPGTRTFVGGVEPVLADVKVLSKHPMLSASVSKFVWAQRRLVELDSRTTEWINVPANQVDVVGTYDGESGQFVFRLGSVPDAGVFADEFA